jgi:3'-5' exonuclease
MKPSIIVWDLETVPDLGGFAAANDLVGKSDVEVREAIGDKFPKHIYHSIVCIGALIAHREPDHWVVDAVGAPHLGERTEKELITAFCDASERSLADFTKVRAGHKEDLSGVTLPIAVYPLSSEHEPPDPD